MFLKISGGIARFVTPWLRAWHTQCSKVTHVGKHCYSVQLLSNTLHVNILVANKTVCRRVWWQKFRRMDTSI